MDLTKLSSNWKRLLASSSLTSDSNTKRDPSNRPPRDNGLKRKETTATAQTSTKRVRYSDWPGSKVPRSRKEMNGRHDPSSPGENTSTSVVPIEQSAGQVSISKEPAARIVGDRINEGLCTTVDVGKYVALDCEMVGVGPNPALNSALARVSVVNYEGEQVYDSYVRPMEAITDYRTHVSGIEQRHMTIARSFQEVQKDVFAILKARVVIGHSVRRDFEALMLSHPRMDIRDTAKHPPYRKLVGGGSPKLKILVSDLLGIEIQTGQHSSIEDARATMLLFRRDKDAFEAGHRKKSPQKLRADELIDGELLENDSKKEKRKKKKKKKKR